MSWVEISVGRRDAYVCETCSRFGAGLVAHRVREPRSTFGCRVDTGADQQAAYRRLSRQCPIAGAGIRDGDARRLSVDVERALAERLQAAKIGL